MRAETGFCRFVSELVTGTNLRKKQDIYKMENYAKAGIRTVKGFKTNDVLFQKITEQAETYEGGQDQFLRDVLAEKLFQSNHINYGELMELQDMKMQKRNIAMSAMVGIETSLFFADFEQTKGFSRGFMAGEILERFANQREIPKIIEPVKALKPETVKELEPNEPENSRIIEINLDELSIDTVRESLENHGFNEMNYLTKESIAETEAQLQLVLSTETAILNEKVRNLEFVNDRLNAEVQSKSKNTEILELIQDFENMLNFAKELAKANKGRNGIMGVFTKITEKDIIEVCPVKFKHHFV